MPLASAVSSECVVRGLGRAGMPLVTVEQSRHQLTILHGSLAPTRHARAGFCRRSLEEERGALRNGRCGEPAFAVGAGTPLWGQGPVPPGPPRSDGIRGDRACMHRGDRRGPRVPQPVYSRAGEGMPIQTFGIDISARWFDVAYA